MSFSGGRLAEACGPLQAARRSATAKAERGSMKDENGRKKKRLTSCSSFILPPSCFIFRPPRAFTSADDLRCKRARLQSPFHSPLRPCISRHNDRSECNLQRSSGAEEAAALLSSPALAEVYHIAFPHTSRMRHACLVIAASANPEFAALAEHRPRTYSIMRRVRGARRYSASANRSSAFSKPGTGNRETGQRARPAGRLQH